MIFKQSTYVLCLYRWLEKWSFGQFNWPFVASIWDQVSLYLWSDNLHIWPAGCAFAKWRVMEWFPSCNFHLTPNCAWNKSPAMVFRPLHEYYYTLILYIWHNNSIRSLVGLFGSLVNIQILILPQLSKIWIFFFFSVLMP